MVSWREQLAFAPLEAAERGEEIERRIRHAIELGVLEDGTQLPSENDLAARMRVSTQTLRAALAELRHLGLVETRRGRGGGSFVRANTGDIAKARRESLAAYSLEDLRDIREYRAVLAGSAAAAAAARAQQISIARLASLAGMIGSARTPAEMTRADSQFHLELSAASRSVRLTRQEMTLQAEIGPLIWTNTPNRATTAASEHTAIVEAIREGDPVLARAHAEDHVRHDMNGLIDLRMSMDSAASLDSAVPGAPPAASTGDRLIAHTTASIESLATRIRETAGASIRVVEEAVRKALNGAPMPRLDDLAGVYDVVHETLDGATPAFYGLGFLADASFFGDAEIIWAFIPPGQDEPQRLEMDLEFYDYASTPWWPRDGVDDLHVSYAYVDANGSNAYIVTFSKMIMIAGRPAGAAMTDILITQLQSGFEPLLLSLPPGSSIVDQNGVVIATNSGSLIGGALPRERTQRSAALPAVPWRLFVGDEKAGGSA
ncbi:FCD domain-containing protein [Sinomonas sp. JGH33]|uniref:FCD domain-containing protein n=1 Tax=Sinomonas terricola TaxID=3110330 RepID=A0ABU5T3Y0_9MICC|nr:FCD domain-containing protein [Sinomonas sp. JGH33]MEA5453846.1 FCD domain-containing protein [Sinomonas sp. JGH33]